MLYWLKFFKLKPFSPRTPVMHIFLAKGTEKVTGGKYSLVRPDFLREILFFQDKIF